MYCGICRLRALEIQIDGEIQDLALIDVALSRERFVASRAIWDMSTLYEVFLTRAEPASIGLSSVGGQLHPVSIYDQAGLRYILGDGSGEATSLVKAPIAPGVVSEILIAEWETMEIGVPVPVERRHCTVAVDGERAFSITAAQQLDLVLQRNGPRVINVEAAMRAAAEQGVLLS